MTNEMNQKKKIIEKIRLTIGAKLIGIIALLLIASLATVVWLSTRMFIQDNTTLIQQINADAAAGAATQVRELFTGLMERSRVFGTALMHEFKDKNADKILATEFFNEDKDFLALFLYEKQQKTALIKKAISSEMELLNDAEGEKLKESLDHAQEMNLENVFEGAVEITSLKLSDGQAAIAFSFPFIKNGPAFSHILTCVIRQKRVLKVFNDTAIINSYLVDRTGKVVAHPDTLKNWVGESVADLEIVKQLLSGKFNNGQTRFYDSSSKIFKLGAFRVVGFGGLGIVADVPEAKAFEAAKRVEYRAFLIAVIILCVAFAAGYFFSGTITTPIQLLVKASRMISEGNFNVALASRGKDEVAELSNAFNEMAKGLEERDKVKAVFNKFHNKEIADKLLSGEVKLGGERLNATIFFSDVRGFTAMSESMEPEQVVEMLNEYMTRMVSVIRAHGGIVDKYVGDAIMALWGVPIPNENDTLNAVRACIAMRKELESLNELRKSRGQGALMIGMGLNCGMVVAGNIGSEEKMEYTVIGDTVNTASRMESMTKEYGTDFLIPKAIQEKVKNQFVFEQQASVRVKGKTEAIDVFTVRGYIDESGKEILVETAYSSYGKEKSDKAVH